MEQFFINLGFSYTLSKVFPFLLMAFIGILGAIFLSKFIYKKPIKIVLSVLAFILPLGIYFALHPIYQGDLNNASRTVEKTVASELKPNTLYVISIPGCPWCKLSIKDVAQLTKRNPNLKVTYLVVGNDEEGLNFYKGELPDGFNLKLADSPKEVAQVAQGTYPTFAIMEGDKFLTWNNSQFGAFAWDKIISLAK